MAQVKQKVALFESFKGPGSSPPVDAAAGVVTATTTTTATVRGPVHHSSSKYHAVFPGLNLGDTVAGTLMTGVVPRISEEREDEVVQEALQEDEEEEKEEATTAGKKMAPLALDKEMQTGSCRSSTTTTQHITTALQELQLTEGEDGKQAAAASLPSNPTEGKDEEGPEPIIECNHKQPAASASSVARLAAATHHDDEAASTDHSVGGFLGMVQKTLGLGKHRPSIPPAVPPPAVARKPLEPLPPLRPEDTYVMSESDEDGNSHGVEDDSSDEEDQERKRRAQKEVNGVASWMCIRRLVVHSFCCCVFRRFSLNHTDPRLGPWAGPGRRPGEAVRHRPPGMGGPRHHLSRSGAHVQFGRNFQGPQEAVLQAREQCDVGAPAQCP